MMEQSQQPVQPSVNGATMSDGSVPLARYWQIILKRILTVIVVTVGVVSLVAVYTFREPKIYEARTTIVIDLQRPQVLGTDVQPVVDLSPADYWNSSQFYQTQYKIITSRMMAQKVVNTLGLADDLEFLHLSHIDDPEALAKALEATDPVDVLLKGLEIEPALDSRMVGIVFRHTSPEHAMRVATAVAETYQDMNADDKMESTGRAHRWLTSQYQDVKKRLEDSDRAMYDFRRENNVLTTSLEDRQTITTQRLMDLNQRLTAVRSERLRAGAEVEQIRQMRRSDLRGMSFNEVIDNPLVQSLKTTHTQLRQREAELGEKYLDGHPELAAVHRQREAAGKDLDREIVAILATADNRLKVLQRTEGGLEQELDSVKEEALELSEKELVYAELKREHQNNERMYDLVLKRLKETDLSRFLKDNNVRLLDTARVPVSPVYPRVWLNLLIGVVTGLVAGVGLAFVKEMLDHTIRTQADVEEDLQMTFLGLIPAFKSDNEGGGASDTEVVSNLKELHCHNFPKSTAAECCRMIRTNLLFMSPERPLSRLAVTSPGPQEGKTITSANIATVMAQSNTRVLLVDTDMRRPRLHHVFAMDNSVGMTSLILGESTYEDAIRHTVVPNLDVLCCGPIPPNPAELLHTERFQEIMRNLDARYDRVIFDTPPTMVVADAMIIANLVDGVVFVVSGGKTSKDVARQARSKLVGVNAPLLGCIVNNVDLQDRQYGQYYYNYGRYGGYYGEEEDSELDAEPAKAA